jgi:hypothetical protein
MVPPRSAFSEVFGAACRRALRARARLRAPRTGPAVSPQFSLLTYNVNSRGPGRTRGGALREATPTWSACRRRPAGAEGPRRVGRTVPAIDVHHAPNAGAMAVLSKLPLRDVRYLSALGRRLGSGLHRHRRGHPAGRWNWSRPPSSTVSESAARQWLLSPRRMRRGKSNSSRGGRAERADLLRASFSGDFNEADGGRRDAVRFSLGRGYATPSASSTRYGSTWRGRPHAISLRRR